MRHDVLGDPTHHGAFVGNRIGDGAEGLLKGAFPSDDGCAFRTRCPLVTEGVCASQTPPAR